MVLEDQVVLAGLQRQNPRSQLNLRVHPVVLMGPEDQEASVVLQQQNLQWPNLRSQQSLQVHQAVLVVREAQGDQEDQEVPVALVDQGVPKRPRQECPQRSRQLASQEVLGVQVVLEGLVVQMVLADQVCEFVWIARQIRLGVKR